jgi:hypothetical protein
VKTLKMDFHVDVDQLEAVDDVEALDQSWAAVSCHLGIFHDPVKVPDGDDPEPGYPSPTLQAVLAQHSPDITVTVVSLADILAGCLSDSEKCYTALCVPGGFAPNYSSRLGARGIAIIRDFVSRGGGFVGICAGAYLGSSACLGLLPVECLDMHRWNRGAGPCQLRYTHTGSRALGAPAPAAAPSPPRDDCEAPDDFTSGARLASTDTVTVRYANGPLMRIDGLGAAASYANFATEFRGAGHAGSREGSRLEGSPAVVVGRSGTTGGVVALCSPHLEDGTDDVRTLLPFANLMRLTCRGSFYQQWVLQQSPGLGLEPCVTQWEPPWRSPGSQPATEIRWL